MPKQVRTSIGTLKSKVSFSSRAFAANSHSAGRYAKADMHRSSWRVLSRPLLSRFQLDGSPQFPSATPISADFGQSVLRPVLLRDLWQNLSGRPQVIGNSIIWVFKISEKRWGGSCVHQMAAFANERRNDGVGALPVRAFVRRIFGTELVGTSWSHTLRA